MAHAVLWSLTLAAVAAVGASSGPSVASAGAIAPCPSQSSAAQEEWACQALPRRSPVGNVLVPPVLGSSAGSRLLLSPAIPGGGFELWSATAPGARYTRAGSFRTGAAGYVARSGAASRVVVAWWDSGAGGPAAPPPVLRAGVVEADGRMSAHLTQPSPAAGVGWRPSVAVGADGAVAVAWSVDGALFVAEAPSTGPFGVPQQVATGGWVGETALEPTPDGGFVLAWADNGPRQAPAATGGGRVSIVERPPGAPWQASEVVAEERSTRLRGLRVRAGARGARAVIWAPADRALRLAVRSGAGAPYRSGVVTVEQPRRLRTADVAVDRGGRVLVAYAERHREGQRVVLRSGDVTRPLLGRADVIDRRRTSITDVRLTLDRAGRGLVTYVDGAASRGRLAAAIVSGRDARGKRIVSGRSPVIGYDASVADDGLMRLAWTESLGSDIRTVVAERRLPR